MTAEENILKQTAKPERDTTAFQAAHKAYCLENSLDPDTAFYDLPLNARSEIMRRAHEAIQGLA